MSNVQFSKDPSGRPVIILNADYEFPFMFGIWKAKKFLENRYKINAHLEMYDNKETYRYHKQNKIPIPRLRLEENTRYPIELNIYRCKLIINNIESIKLFIASAGSQKVSASGTS